MKMLWGFLLVLVLVAPAWSYQVDDPLLRVLIRKGILSEDEALEILQEARKEKVLEEQRTRKIAQEVARKESTKVALPKGLRGVKLGTLTYIDYSAGKKNGESYNKFAITRGYLNFKKKINDWLSFRMTPDVHLDDNGDLNVRIKYAYAGFKLPSFGFLTDIKMEAGQGHFPWLVFQEHINPYRAQGTMARERAGTFNSADVGVSIAGYFGGRLDKTYVRELSSHYPVFNHYDGKYGSWWFSLMNGGGYHAKENNQNKVIEGRITLRPFGDYTQGFMPLAGLQFSYFFIRGEGNNTPAENYSSGYSSGLVSANTSLDSWNKEYPDYNLDLFMLSYQHTWFVITLEYSTSEGNNSGKWVGPTGEALDTELWSVFADVTLPVFGERLHLFGRYDSFDPDEDDVWTAGIGDDEYDLYMVGLAYQVYKKNMILLVNEWVDYERNNGGLKKLPSVNKALDNDYRIQLVYQVSF